MADCLTLFGLHASMNDSTAGLVAQLVEQRTENPRVGGSTPSQATNLLNNLPEHAQQ
jgi:hypothetical protein